MAQEAGQPVAVIDQERLFEQSAFGARILGEIDARTEALAAENRRIEEMLTAEEQSLTQRRDAMPREEFRVLAQAFDARVNAMRDAQDGKARALSRMQDEAQAEFFRRASGILTEVLRDRGALVLLDRRAVLSAVPGVDITDAAITRIDAAIGDGGPMPETAEP